jgi:hypothetical protein
MGTSAPENRVLVPRNAHIVVAGGTIRSVRWRLALLVLACTAAACGNSSSGSPAAPIVGYWSWNDGVVQIKSVGSNSFEGAFVQARTGSCIPKVGHVMLKLTGSGAHYTGEDEWYRLRDCASMFTHDTKVDLSNGNNTATLCSSGPFTDVAPVSDCKPLTRLPNYKPK